jgi:hypothetical protein
METQSYYIIMGDIITSRESKDAGKMMNSFRETIDQINAKHEKNILSPLTVTGGDEFQGVAADIDSLLTILLDIDESFQLQTELNLRYVLHYGAIATAINPKSSYEMYGEGLTFAHEKLENYSRDQGRFYFSIDPVALSDHLQDAFFIYQSLVDDWREADVEVVRTYLTHQDYKSLFEQGMYKTRSGAWKKVQTLKLEEYLALKRMILRSPSLIALS